MQLQKQNLESKSLCIVYSNIFKTDFRSLIYKCNEVGDIKKYLSDTFETNLTQNEKYALHIEKIKMKDYIENYKIDGILLFNEITSNIKVPFNYLFYRGDINLIYEKNLAIVGSRKTTIYVEKLTRKFIHSYLPNQINIINGLAAGSDTIALEEGLSNFHKSIVVIPTPFSKISPVKNKKLLEQVIKSGGLAMTEYYDIDKVYKSNFLKRNEIINYFSSATLATEFGLKSGTKSQIKNAKESRKLVATFKPCETFQEYLQAFQELENDDETYILKDTNSIRTFLTDFELENYDVFK